MKRNNSNKRQKESSSGRRQQSTDNEPRGPQLKKVGQFLIDMDRHLGEGQYGKVYLSQELNDPNKALSNMATLGSGSNGASITKHQPQSFPSSDEGQKYYACKVVERQQLCKVKEDLVVSEI